MTSSASNRPQGVLFDTNVLSLFARVERLPLLLQAFANLHQAKQIYISPTIQQELVRGIQNGAAYLQAALQLVITGDLQTVYPSKADQQFIYSLPAKLAAGEAEAIALCYRLNLVFISHDRKAVNYCERVGIASIKLDVLLNRLRAAGLLTETEIAKMLM
ncbi:MAG: type II toxin-antitoxin system VapC family toxin [Caldilineaceae bacterium]